MQTADIGSLVTILILHGHVAAPISLHYVATTILSLNFILQLTCFGIKPSSDRCTFTGFKSDICVDQMNTLLLSMTLIWLYVSSCQNYIYRLYLKNLCHTEKLLNKGLNELFMFSDFIEPINFHFLQCYDAMKELLLDNLCVHILWLCPLKGLISIGLVQFCFRLVWKIYNNQKLILLPDDGTELKAYTVCKTIHNFYSCCCFFYEAQNKDAIHNWYIYIHFKVCAYNSKILYGKIKYKISMKLQYHWQTELYSFLNYASKLRPIIGCNDTGNPIFCCVLTSSLSPIPIAG